MATSLALKLRQSLPPCISEPFSTTRTGSDAFLATIDPNFKKLDIYRKRQPSSKAVFWMPVGVQMPSMVISHTAPSEAAREILKDLDGSYFLNKHGDVESRTSRTLQEMFEAHRPSMW
jgi:hypothetical protein